MTSIATRVYREFDLKLSGNNNVRLFALCAGLSLSILVFSGCGGGTDQTGRSPLKGAITYEGQPVPFGDIVFTPDGSKGNSGPEGFALIESGRYDTKGARGKGVAGGPMIVAVSAFRDGPGKGIIVETEFSIEIPKQGGEFQIEIPKKAVPTKPDAEINF